MTLPRGDILLDADVALLLGRLASQLRRPARVTLDPTAIEAAEEALDSSIPFAILALLAVERRLGSLVPDTEAVLDFYEAAGRSPRDVGFAHVAFGVTSPEIEWGEDPELAVFARTHNRAEPARVARWRLRKPTPGGAPYSLAQYIADRHPGASAAATEGPIQFAIEAPAVVAETVMHAKFGRGRVVARGDGKVIVAFDDGPQRTLAERFVTPV